MAQTPEESFLKHLGHERGTQGQLCPNNEDSGVGRAAEPGEGMFVCVYMYICLYACIYICVYMCMYVYMCMFAHMSVNRTKSFPMRSSDCETRDHPPLPSQPHRVGAYVHTCPANTTPAKHPVPDFPAYSSPPNLMVCSRHCSS